MMTCIGRLTCPHAKTTQGFTMMELVLVILITGIMAAIAGAVITRPMQGYESLTRRADLVDQAEMALRRMQRDIRRALPNSIRVSGNAIEMVNVVEGIGYREGVTGSPTAASELDFSSQDGSFNTIGTFRLQPPVISSTDIRLVIYNLPDEGMAGTNVYSAVSTGPFPPVGSHVITPLNTQITIAAAAANEHTISWAPPHQFALRSPNRRLYVIDTPISYICDLGTGILMRYSGYDILPNQPVDPSQPPLNAANASRVSTKLTACAMTYVAGPTWRSGLVRLSLTIADPDTGESVSLMHQVHVDNAP